MTDQTRDSDQAHKQVEDGLKSLIGNLGDPSRDKAASVQFASITLSDEQLRTAFETNWISKKLVLIPIQDATRKWRSWVGEKAKAIEAEEKRLGLKAKIHEAAWKARLYGGAAIYIGTDQDASERLDVERIAEKGIQYLTVLTRVELMAGELETDPFSEHYGKPRDYQVCGTSQLATIHPSRLILFNGDAKPDTWLSNDASAGWGNSVLKAVYDTVTQTGGVFANVASLVFEANVDVIKIPDLMARIGDAGEESALLKRFLLAAANKGINGMLMMDKEEEYERRSAVFAHLPEIMQAFAMYCAAAADIPATRFLAQSPNGMNATGESDMDNYHDNIQSLQELVLEPAMCLFDQCLLQSALGKSTGDHVFHWVPLKQMDEKEEAEIAKLEMEAVAAMESGVVPLEAVYQKLKELKAFEGTTIDSFDKYKTAIQEQNREIIEI